MRAKVQTFGYDALWVGVVHSGEYLAETLFAVIQDFNITPSIFTITRDNAAVNLNMLQNFHLDASLLGTTNL